MIPAATGRTVPLLLVNRRTAAAVRRLCVTGKFIVFDKGMITRHIKNRASLQQTAAIGENLKRRFLCDMDGESNRCPRAFLYICAFYAKWRVEKWQLLW